MSLKAAFAAMLMLGIDVQDDSDCEGIDDRTGGGGSVNEGMPCGKKRLTLLLAS